MQPPKAIPLARVHIPPPPRTSTLGPGPWPSSAQGICALFEADTNVVIDLNSAHMTYELSLDREGLRAWFALEIRRVLALGRPLHANAHVTLITGHRSAVERAPLILRALETEFSTGSAILQTG